SLRRLAVGGRWMEGQRRKMQELLSRLTLEASFEEKTSCSGFMNAHLHLLARSGPAHIIGHLSLELRELLAEQSGQFFGLGVIGCRIGPGMRRAQDFDRHFGRWAGYANAEHRVGIEGHAIERARQSGPEQSSRVSQRHAPADTKRPAGPTR